MDFCLLLEIWEKILLKIQVKTYAIYIQKLLDHAKQSPTYALKTASKRVIHKTAETTSYLIGNKIADKTTTSPQNNSVTNKDKILRER